MSILACPIAAIIGLPKQAECLFHNSVAKAFSLCPLRSQTPTGRGYSPGRKSGDSSTEEHVR